jgi:hypothetical protein
MSVTVNRWLSLLALVANGLLIAATLLATRSGGTELWMRVLWSAHLAINSCIALYLLWNARSWQQRALTKEDVRLVELCAHIVVSQLVFLPLWTKLHPQLSPVLRTISSNFWQTNSSSMPASTALP